MYFRISAFLTMIFLYSPVWAQHPGHQQGSQPPSEWRQAHEGPVLSIHEGIKDSQNLFRDLEKTIRSRDEARFAEVAARYEESIDDLVQSVDSTPQDDRTHAKNLDLAQRSLNRQLQQLEQLASIAPVSAGEWFTRLTDAVNIGRAAILAEQEALRNVDPANGGAKQQGGSGNGCGSRILRRPSFVRWE